MSAVIGLLAHSIPCRWGLRGGDSGQKRRGGSPGLLGF
jgi:hypothetical protein